MDNNINTSVTDDIADFENFEPVWQRVTGGNTEPDMVIEASAVADTHVKIEEEYALDSSLRYIPVLPPQIPGDAVVLRAFLDDEARDEAFFKVLSESSSRYSSVFRKFAADENEHSKKLQIEYFLLMGVCYTPPAPVIVLDGLLNSMRQAYLSERSDSDAYIKAADKTENTVLRSLYLELSRCKMEHAGELRQMISKTL